MYKNRASQKIPIYVWDANTGLGKTGDAANITVKLSKDGGAAATSANAVSELDSTNFPGTYVLTLSQAETNCDLLLVQAVSVTANVYSDLYAHEPLSVGPLLAETNTNETAQTSVGGQLRRVHALVGGNKLSQDASLSNPTIVHRNEADSGNLVTLTTTEASQVTTVTPS